VQDLGSGVRVRVYRDSGEKRALGCTERLTLAGFLKYRGVATHQNLNAAGTDLVESMWDQT